MAPSKEIHYRASAQEWDSLFEWVLKKTAELMEASADKNPWLKPDLSEEDIAKRLQYLSDGTGMVF